MLAWNLWSFSGQGTEQQLREGKAGSGGRDEFKGRPWPAESLAGVGPVRPPSGHSKRGAQSAVHHQAEMRIPAHERVARNKKGVTPKLKEVVLDANH